MDFRTLEVFVEQRRARGAAEMEVGQRHGLAVTLQLKGTAKSKSGAYGRDFVVLTNGWGPSKPGWVDILRAASEVVTPSEREAFRAVAVALWAGEDLDDVLRRHAPKVRRQEWWKLFFLVQLMALQEELNYPQSNGWWTSFHLLRCLWRGASADRVAAAATNMKRQRRPLAVSDCAGCQRCGDGQRPWGEPRPQLRSFYADGANHVKPRFAIEPVGAT